jgi:hypothetical protein
MTKPKKYIDDSEMFRAAEQTKELVKEVASDCQLTLSELALQLRGNGLQISDGLMRQYSSGQKPMGDQRRHDFVSIAVRKLGCRSRTAITLLTFENPDHLKDMRSLVDDVAQGREIAEEMLDRAVRELVEWGVDGKQIRIMLSTALTKYEFIEGVF